MRKRLVLKNKKRFALFVTFIVVIVTSFIFATYVYGYKSGDRENEEGYRRTVMVKSGDTLWDIAEKYAVNTDIRKYIYEIRKINGLDDYTIFPGNILVLPDNR